MKGKVFKVGILIFATSTDGSTTIRMHVWISWRDSSEERQIRLSSSHPPWVLEVRLPAAHMVTALSAGTSPFHHQVLIPHHKYLPLHHQHYHLHQPPQEQQLHQQQLQTLVLPPQLLLLLVRTPHPTDVHKVSPQHTALILKTAPPQLPANAQVLSTMFMPLRGFFPYSLWAKGSLAFTVSKIFSSLFVKH